MLLFAPIRNLSKGSSDALGYSFCRQGQLFTCILAYTPIFCALELRFAYQAENFLLLALIQCYTLELHFADSSAHWIFAWLSISHRTASSSTRQSVRLSTSIRNFSKGSSDALGYSFCRQGQLFTCILAYTPIQAGLFRQRCVVCQTTRSHTVCMEFVRSLLTLVLINCCLHDESLLPALVQRTIVRRSSPLSDDVRHGWNSLQICPLQSRHKQQGIHQMIKNYLYTCVYTYSS